MPAAMLAPDRPPPEDYYQNNCCTLIEFVLAHYADLLSERLTTQLGHYLNLGDDAQRLFARLLTRKGSLIRIDSLNYAEVAACDQALENLSDVELVQLNSQAPADQLLSMLRKAELVNLNPTPLPKSMRKNDVVIHILGQCSDRQIYARMVEHTRWVTIAHPEDWRLVRLLYFGDTEHDWSAFVIRDLGMVRYEPLKMDAKRYASFDVLQADLYYRKLSALSHRLQEHPGLAEELAELLDPEVEDRFIASRRDRCLLRIGRWYERSGQSAAAVRVYGRVQIHPARERIVRVLHRQGDEEAAQQWLQKIRAVPLSEEEAQFAERFGKRRAGYQPAVTQIEISTADAEIEQQALGLLLRPGEWGVHVENSLVRTLTGLVYWDVVFCDVPGAFTNPFQLGPNDLYREDFMLPRLKEIQRIEHELREDADFTRHLLTIVERKQGVANSLVSWQLLAGIDIADIVDAMPVDDMRRLTKFLIRNLHSRRTGLPDLFVVHGAKQYEFVEVKGPADQLQPGQRIWFKHLARLDIPARVLKLKLAK